MLDLSDTVKPKSDQLNADDLIVGPITATISGVSVGSTEQPVKISLSDGLMPYYPCKSMRRVLITAWGADGHEWVGKSLTLYRDPSVRFGGVALGGIRISHLSGIESKMVIVLTTTRSKRAPYEVLPLREKAGVTAQHAIAAFNAAASAEELEKAKGIASTLSADDKRAAMPAYTAATNRLKNNGAMQ